MRIHKRGKVAALASGLALVAGSVAVVGAATSTAGASASSTPGTSAGSAPAESTMAPETTAAGGETTVAGSTPASTETTAAAAPEACVDKFSFKDPASGPDGAPPKVEPFAPVAAPSGKSGGEATYAQEEEGTAYNNSHGLNNNFSNTVVNNLLQPGPFLIDDKLAFVPWTELVLSAGVVQSKPQVVEYKLNPKAVWQDGEPIDFDDFFVLWQAQNGHLSIPNPDYAPGKVDDNGDPVPACLPLFNAASYGGYEQIASVKQGADNFDILVEFNSPFADWKGIFGGMIPAHIVEKLAGVADLTKVDPFTVSDDLKKISGAWDGFNNWDLDKALSGSYYKIENYTKDQGIVLVRNDKFWGTPALLDKITLKTVSDATAQATALENNELQAIQPQADPGVADQLKKAADAGKVTFAPASGLTFEHLDMNMKNPLFQDKAVREAFSMCVDRQDIIDKLVAPVNPEAKPLNNVIFMPNQAAYSDDFTSKFDVEAAKKTLEDGGWKAGGDGVYEKDGKKLAFRISHKGIQRRSDTTQNIIASCKKAGFDITEDSDKKFNGERLPKGDYDVALFAWVGNPLMSAATGIYTPDGGSNFQSYVNAKVGDLYKQANAEFDEAKRVALMQEIDKAIMADHVTIPLFQLPEMPAWSKSLSGPAFNGPLGLTWNAQVWSLA